MLNSKRNNYKIINRFHSEKNKQEFFFWQSIFSPLQTSKLLRNIVYFTFGFFWKPITRLAGNRIWQLNKCKQKKECQIKISQNFSFSRKKEESDWYLNQNAEIFSYFQFQDVSNSVPTKIRKCHQNRSRLQWMI